MLVHLAVIWGGFVVFAFAFAGDDPAAARRASGRFAEPIPSRLAAQIADLP